MIGSEGRRSRGLGGWGSKSAHARRPKARRHLGLEPLEDRKLLTWTFSISGSVASATSDGGADTLYIAESGGNLYHSTDGSSFSSDWSGDSSGTTLPASPSSTINIDPTTSSNAHVINIGFAPLSAASANKAQINIVNGGASDSLSIDDTMDTSAASGANAYSIVSGVISTPLGIDVQATGGALGGGITLEGGSAADTYTVTGTRASEPIILTGNDAGGNTFDLLGTLDIATVNAGSGTGNVVNLGDPTHTASALGNVTVTGSTGLSIDDSADAATATVSITMSSLSFGVSNLPAFDYGGATLTGLTFDSGSSATTVAVTAPPAGTAGEPAPITLNLGTSTGNAVSVANSAGALSGLGMVTIATATGGETGLTIDDTADTLAGQGYYFDSSQLSFVPDPSNESVKTPLIDYGGATLNSTIFDADSDGTTVIVHRTPSGLPAATAMVLNMGTSANNTVSLGESEADALGDVTVTGDMGLTVDDGNGFGHWTIDVTATTTTFAGGGPTFDYGGATLSALSLAVNNNGANTVDVTGMPSLPAGTAMPIGSFSGSGDVYNLGDSTHAASLLGSIDLSPSGDGSATLSIDDAAGAAGSTVTVSSSSVTFGTNGPVFDYTAHEFAGLTFDASDAGGTTVDVTGAPAASSGPAPITLAMGTGSSNAAVLGTAADSLGDVTVTTGIGGSTGLDISDSDGVASTITVTDMTTAFAGGPTIDYCGATLGSMNLTTSGVSGNVVDVTAVPTITGMWPLIIWTSANGPLTVNLGDATHAASLLGSLDLNAISAPIDLTVEDTGGDGSTAVGIGPSAINFDGGPTFGYQGSELSSLTLDAADAGSNAVDVNGSPMAASGLAAITLNMGLGTGNSIQLGDADGAASGLGDVTITTSGSAPNPGTTSLEVDDSMGSAGQDIHVGSQKLDFLNGPTFDYSGADLAGLTLDASGYGGNGITVTGSPQLVGLATIIKDAATPMNPDAITIGDAAHPASGLAGDVNVTGTGFTSLTIDDSGSNGSNTYLLQAGQFTTGAAPGVGFGSATNLTGLTIEGSTGGDTWDVPATSASVPTTIDTAPGSGLTDTVDLSDDNNRVSNLAGAVDVRGGGAGMTALVIDDSGGTTSRSAMLVHDTASGFNELTGFAPASLGYDSGVAQVSLLASPDPSATTTLTVDFSQGNPLPAGPGTSFTFGAQLGGANTLVLQGELPGPTPFDAETYSPTANQAGAGTIALRQGSTMSILDFGGLAPIDDTVPVSSYTLVAPSSAQVVNVTAGPTIDTFATDTISSGDTPSAFELVNFANKSGVLVDLSAIADPTYIQPPATPATGLNNLTVQYFGNSTTGHTLDVNGTTPGLTTTILLGGYGNTVAVQSVTAGGPLVINDVPGIPGGVNAVTIGNNGNVANIDANVTINGPAKSTDVTVDASADSNPLGAMVLDLNMAKTMADLTGLLPGATLSYDPVGIHSMSVSTGTGSDSLTVDFHNGNPFLGSGLGSPAPSPYALQYNGGGGGDSLKLEDSSGTTSPDFESESYLASGPGAGSVNFYGGTLKAPVFAGAVVFSQLTPVTDSTPVMSYTFTPPMSGGTISVTDAPTSGYTLISDPSPSPSFESVAYSNKADVTIDATPVSRNNLIALNNPTPAVGEQSMAVLLGSGNDTVNVAHNPGPNVDLMILGGVGSQTVSVNGAGLATGTDSSSFGIMGGAGPSTLLLNDQGVGGPLTLQAGTWPGSTAALFGSIASMVFLDFGTVRGFETNNAPTFVIPSPLPTIPTQTGVPLINIPVATFQDADLTENAASYQATINWGDGTAPTVGSIAADPSTPGRYIISGSHTYLAAGKDTITVTLTDLGGTFNSTLDNAGGAVVPVAMQLDAIAAVGGVTAKVSVTDPDPTPSPTPTPPDPPAPTLSWGRLSPQSDSGVSNSDGITNVTTPTFVGGATPGSIIQVFETPTGSLAAPVLIATGVADNSGAWAATVMGSAMADGSYQITATAIDSGGTASASLGTVVIDTVAPVITNVVFRHQRGEMDVYFLDNLSGVFLADLSNGANYQLSATPLNNHIAVPRVIIPTSVGVVPGATPTSVDEAVVQFNHGKPLNGGHYSFQVIAAGITDIAGNALNGRFYGSYPSGNMDPGGNYQAQITAFPRKVLGAFPYKTGYASPRPVPAARSMARSEAVKARPQHVAQAQVATSRPTLGHADSVDQAIAALAGHVHRRHRS